jgi:hypothetical protein
MKYIRVLPAELFTPSAETPHPRIENAIPGDAGGLDAGQSPNSDSTPLPTIPLHVNVGSAQNYAQPSPNHPGYLCWQCGTPFWRKGNGAAQIHKFCSTDCATAFKTGKPNPGFITPTSDEAMRIRAQGLVNKRLKLGWFTVPSDCMKCGEPKRLVSHHQDYQKPNEVHWICYGCHQLVHHTPSLLDGIAPFICNDRRTEAEKPKPHSKGGWRGERGNEYRIARSGMSMDTARAIRRMSADFVNQQGIAAHFGVSQMTVSRIVRNERMIDSLPAPATTEAQ